MRFLYATDGSEGALAGATFLSRLPLTEADRIALLTVVQTEETKADAAPALDRAQEALAGTRATLSRHVRKGNAAAEIIDAIAWMAEETPSDLVVLGTRGLTGLSRFFLGSVAERTARLCPSPVLVARPQDARKPVERVIVGFDGSKSARHAASFVDRMPFPRDTEILLATMTMPREAGGFLPGALGAQVETMRREEQDGLERQLNEMAKALRGTGRNVRTVLNDADPASGLLQLVEDTNADLLAVGALGLTGIERYLMGSVADRVLRHAPCSVLIVRPLPGTE